MKLKKKTKSFYIDEGRDKFVAPRSQGHMCQCKWSGQSSTHIDDPKIYEFFYHSNHRGKPSSLLQRPRILHLIQRILWLPGQKDNSPAISLPSFLSFQSFSTNLIHTLSKPI